MWLAGGLSPTHRLMTHVTRSPACFLLPHRLCRLTQPGTDPSQDACTPGTVRAKVDHRVMVRVRIEARPGCATPAASVLHHRYPRSALWHRDVTRCRFVSATGHCWTSHVSSFAHPLGIRLWPKLPLARGRTGNMGQYPVSPANQKRRSGPRTAQLPHSVARRSNRPRALQCCVAMAPTRQSPAPVAVSATEHLDCQQMTPRQLRAFSVLD